jgi:hypothetical protein
MKLIKEIWHVLLVTILVGALICGSLVVACVDYGVFKDKFPNAIPFGWIWSSGK